MTSNEAVAVCRDILTRLRAAGIEGAIVAGGFLRDTLLGFEPKDIDVFLPRDMGYSEALLTEAMGEPVFCQFELSYSGMECGKVFSTQLDLDKLTVQLIEVDDPVARVREHDFGLCQIWYGPDMVLSYTPEFAKDWAHKTCTLSFCEDETQHARSLRRWARLSEKLMGYTLVDPTPWA